MSCGTASCGMPATVAVAGRQGVGRCGSARNLAANNIAGCSTSGRPATAAPALPRVAALAGGSRLRSSASCPHLVRAAQLAAVAEPEDRQPNAPSFLSRAPSIHEHIPDSLGWPEKTFNFTPERFLGKGSFGQVFLAHDPLSEESVAVKAVRKDRLAGDVTSKAQLFATLQREVDIMLAMQSPQVVQLKSVYEDEQFAYITMEVCDSNLQEFLDCHPGPIPEPVAMSLARQMLAVLQQAHERSICYSDIKPANFLIKARPDGGEFGIEVKLTDFGCSQDLSDDDFLTARTGTPLYTAPEVFLGRYGLAADIWGVGMILYRMLAGEFPFRPNLETAKPFAMMMSVLHDPLRLDTPAWEQVSEEAKHLVRGMMARCVDKRLTAAQALAHPALSAPQQCPCPDFMPFQDVHITDEVVANNVEPFRRQCHVAVQAESA